MTVVTDSPIGRDDELAVVRAVLDRVEVRFDRIVETTSEKEMAT